MNTLARHKTHKAITPDLINARLNAKGFHTQTSIQQLSDPIAKTAMIVTLEQLRPYDSNPRTTKNPAYEEIKESIKARGLDNPPPITRRPGDEFYIIRNGGNTRLEILRELYKETRDEKFNRINCLFHPWDSETSMLVGHLAENEVRGNLSFIEKAVGVRRLKEMYESEGEGKRITQNDLAQRLKGDGFPVSRPHISKMLDTVDCLLPAIPQTLYSGLGKPQIEKLLSLRSGLTKVFKTHGNGKEEDFRDFWISTLSGFDVRPDEFKFNRIEDEMIGRLSERIGYSYKMIQLDLYGIDPGRDGEEQADDDDDLSAPTMVQSTELPVIEKKDSPAEPTVKKKTQHLLMDETQDDGGSGIAPESKAAQRRKKVETDEDLDRSVLNIVGYHKPSARLEDDWIVDGAGGNVNNPKVVRIQSLAAALEIAKWGGNVDFIIKTDDGIGFTIDPNAPANDKVKADTAVFVLSSLLHFFDVASLERREDLYKNLFSGMWSQVLLGGYDIALSGMPPQSVRYCCIPDDVLLTLFRLIRLARQAVRLQMAIDQEEQATLSR
jgi:ParB family protein of integrating conjugative element (PFGI_1 class)